MEKGKIIKVWISKHALTQGLFEESVREYDGFEGMVEVASGYPCYYHKGEWHRTQAEAIKKAEELKEKKIKSLTKSIQKIKNKKF